MSAAQQLAELTQISTVRALAPEESDELFRALRVETQRQSRIPARIMRLRQELHAWEAELWPCFLPKLRALEEHAEAVRIAELEKECGLDRKGPANG